MTNADLTGHWKITKMEVWDAAYIDLAVPGMALDAIPGPRPSKCVD